MRLLIGITLALFAAVGLAWLVIQDPGYVLISAGQWTIEASFVVFAVFLIVAFLVIYWLFRLLMGLFRAPKTVKTGMTRYREDRAQRLLAKGTRELEEARWKDAEVTFMKSVAHSEAPALHYIGAARAANRLNEPVRRDSYLRKAQDIPGRDSLAVGLVEAEIMLDNKGYSQARDLLERLRRQHPNNPRALALLAQSYKALGQWKELREIMPQAQKHRALTESEFVALQEEMYRELLDAAASKGALEDLKALWSDMPPALRSSEPLLIDYVGHLRDNNAAGEAETLLRGALRQQWSDKLVVGYGEIGRGDAAGQLQAAEGWLPQHQNDPYLLLTLGRLAKRCRQYEKARKYLEQSISVMPSPDAFQELGDLLEQTNNQDAANQCYRTGLRLVSGQPEAPGEGVELLPAARAEDREGGAERPADDKSVAKQSGNEPVLQ